MSDNKIGTNSNTGLRVHIEQSRARQTADTSFGHVMSEGLNRGADAVLQAGQLAAPFIPGGAVLSAAITGVGSLKSSAAGQTASASGAMTATAAGANAQTIGSAGSVSGSASGANTATVGPSGGAGGGQLDMVGRMEKMQEMNMSFNMQYLGLQQKMQDESRRFTLLSNIMKTKHDTAKNSISNIR